MNINRNKLIFLVIISAIVFFFVFLAIIARFGNDEQITNTKTEDFKIWIVGDDNADFLSVISEFKNLYPKYKTKNVVVESFGDYQEYYLALTSAFAKGEAPDIFVLNNNEKSSIFDGYVKGLESEFFSVSDFRKKYKTVFGDDLIFTYNEGEETKEALKGIPVGYETLGIFYNGRYVKSSDLEYISSLNAKISELKESKFNYVPIGIGNGSTVYNAQDIVTQFFMLEDGVKSLSDVRGNSLKESIGTYLYYGDETGDNAYNERFDELKKIGNNNLDLFSKGEIYMVVGYPRMIKKIDEKGYSTNLLRAGAFPHYFSGQGKTLINYNYFVINKQTSDLNFSYDLLGYLMSDNGAMTYLKKFPYYFPALLSLETDRLDSRIHPDYKIYLSDFYNNDYLLSSFDKQIKNLYDKNIISILDNPVYYESEFNNFRDNLVCKFKKIINLENLSKNCE